MKKAEPKTSKMMNEFCKEYQVGKKCKGMTIQDYCRDEKGTVYVLLKLKDFVNHIQGSK